MSGDRYYITDQHATYFLTFTVVDWIDIFTKPVYKTIITDALNYCSENKGWKIYAWVLMSNHLHLVLQTQPPFRMSDTMRDFKKFTSKKIIEAIQQVPESRREWLLDKFSFNAKVIHQNPVAAMIVANAEDYLLSSANVYAGSKQALVKLSLYNEDATVDAGRAY